MKGAQKRRLKAMIEIEKSWKDRFVGRGEDGRIYFVYDRSQAGHEYCELRYGFTKEEAIGELSFYFMEREGAASFEAAENLRRYCKFTEEEEE